MRVAVAFVLAVAFWSGVARASSFLVLPATTQKLSSSMIELGSPVSTPGSAALDPDVVTPPEMAEADSPKGAASGGEVQLSPSIVALGGPPVVSQEEVAAIGSGAQKRRRPSLPTISRGGVVADGAGPNPADTLTLTTGFDQQSTAKQPEASGPVDPAEAPKPAVAPEVPAAPHPAEVVPPVE